MIVPRRGEVWRAYPAAPVDFLVVSSTVYNEIASEPTVLGVPVVNGVGDHGFGVAIGAGRWVLAGLIGPVEKAALVTRTGSVDVQTLTNVDTMLFKILATPER
ncbi:MazF family transcriptional regulator [Gandjariella thermophila]|uniref:Uncharacterized protein n=1 Tax=Gandjariella thermophila TaxID=1931992 RepID=A0A4D4JE01_9PSEU|nr:MazF family transcriptional regulator [Gandjariella thermophila]GDY32579.1 hypothetical protein GTS_42120 [Gandjariella thermophila]